MSRRRIGILGGMYDPVHDGHLRAAIEARELLALDEIRLVPCATPPHRDAPRVTAALRAEMVAAAVEGVEGLLLDDRELKLPPPSYTLRTLQSLREEQPENIFVLLLGEDAFRNFHRWHHWQRITELAHVAVMRRPGGGEMQWADELRNWLETAALAAKDLAECNAQAGHAAFCEITALDISSTRIRELIASRRNPRFLLPDAVLDIIDREQLYETGRKN